MRSLCFVVLFVITISANVQSRTYSSDQIHSHLTSIYGSWGIKEKKNSKNLDPSINLKKALSIFKERKVVTVAVVDTGIDFNHVYFKKNIIGRFLERKSASSKKKEFIHKLKLGTKDNYGYDFSNSHKGTKFITRTPKDTHGHGTHVSGIIKSIYPNVKIIPIKYYNEFASGEQNLENSIRALEHAVKLGVDIINYSGGGPEADPSNKAKELRIVKKAQEKGIIIVAAAGNNGNNIDVKENMYFPASYSSPDSYNLQNIIAVGSYDTNLKLINSSNYGIKTVHVAAPGHRINSAVVKSSAKMSGTSQATAFVSGVAALLKSSYPQLNYKQIKNIIVSTSKNLKLFQGKVIGGQLDAYKTLQKANQILTPRIKPLKKLPIKPLKRNVARTR